MSNSLKGKTLREARIKKNDEFYTLYENVELELKNYSLQLHDKVIYCNCDNPEQSNFWKYFHLNFSKLKLKKLIATCYVEKTLFNQIDTYKYEYAGGNDSDIKDYNKILLNGDGSFQSIECIKILQESDIVITNPPFSLFREYVELLVRYNKKFLIVGNQNAITYKEIFSLIKGNKLWLGYGVNLKMICKTPYPNIEESNRKYVLLKGYDPDEGYNRVKGTTWFTNIEIKKNLKKIKFKKIYDINSYPVYDNYQAINIDKMTDIPDNYFKPMGVPITFFNNYDYSEFDILGCADANILPDGWQGLSVKFIKLYYEQGNTGVYKVGNRLAGYIDSDGNAKVPYKRVIIKRREP